MRWIKFDTSVGGMFSREVCPEDSEYLLSHIDTFKCMWHEQTRNYWVRMVISLREYVKKHIFTYESLERLGAPVEIFEMLIEYAYINICTNFTQDSFGKAKDFLMAIISVTASKDMKGQIGTRPLSNDPFYNKFTRDSYRTVFGQPTSTIKMQLQVYISAPLYGRFAAGVVAILKQWVHTTDCSLKDFYQKFHSNSYWPYPDDFCPRKIFFKFLEESCHGWESPDCEEVEQVMIQAPDRKTEFVDVVAVLPSDLMDFSGADLDDSGSEHSDDSDGDYGIKNWHDIMFAVSDHLIFSCPFHVEQLCATCMLGDVSNNSGDESDSISVRGDYEDSDSDDAASEDYNFWHQPKVLSLLHAAERKYRERMLNDALETHTGESAANAPASSRKNRKTRKTPRVTLSINVTQATQRPQPVFMKNGAVPPPKSKLQPEIINFEDDDEKASKIAAALERLKLKIESNGTPPAPQQPEKPQEVATSQERAKSRPPQKAAPPKEVQAAGKKLSANGAAAVSKTTQRKCANCSKSEGVKLKKCSLCVQQKMDPVYYCSRECQMEDWEEHQTIHTDDID